MKIDMFSFSQKYCIILHTILWYFKLLKTNSPIGFTYLGKATRVKQKCHAHVKQVFNPLYLNYHKLRDFNFKVWVSTEHYCIYLTRYVNIAKSAVWVIKLHEDIEGITEKNLTCEKLWDNTL